MEKQGWRHEGFPCTIYMRKRLIFGGGILRALLRKERNKNKTKQKKLETIRVVG